MDAPRRRDEQGQLALVAMVLALCIAGLLTALAVGAFTNSGPGGGSGIGPVGTADDVQAEQSLNTAVQIAGEAGTFGALSPSIMSQTGGSGITYTASASTSPSTVSVASSGGITGGSAEFAVYSAGKNCWFAWVGPGGPFYGVQTRQAGCQAASPATTPTAGGTPTSSGITWKAGGFPSP